MFSIQKLNNVSFGTKFVIGENYLEDNKGRMKAIGDNYQEITKDTPGDKFVVNTGYIEYYKGRNKIPLTFNLSGDEFIKPLFNESDDTILEKFKLMSDIAKHAFKCDNVVGKFLNKITELTNDESITISCADEDYTIAESYANRAVAEDPVLSEIVSYVIFN